MKPIPVCVLLFSVSTAFPVATALSAEGDQRPYGPPPAAFDACNGKSAGDGCVVTLRDRTISGACKELPEGGRLVCAPDHLPPGPPPEQR